MLQFSNFKLNKNIVNHFGNTKVVTVKIKFFKKKFSCLENLIGTVSQILEEIHREFSAVSTVHPEEPTPAVKTEE